MSTKVDRYLYAKPAEFRWSPSSMNAPPRFSAAGELDRLADALCDGNPVARQRAALELARASDPRLLDALFSDDAELSMIAQVRADEASLKRVFEDHEDERARARALVLRAHRSGAEAAIEGLADESPVVRATAAINIRPHDVSLLEDIARSDEDPIPRLAALEVLGHLGHEVSLEAEYRALRALGPRARLALLERAGASSPLSVYPLLLELAREFDRRVIQGAVRVAVDLPRHPRVARGRRSDRANALILTDRIMRYAGALGEGTDRRIWTGLSEVVVGTEGYTFLRAVPVRVALLHPRLLVDEASVRFFLERVATRGQLGPLMLTETRALRGVIDDERYQGLMTLLAPRPLPRLWW